MATAQERVFEDAPAERKPTPLLFGVAGPSGSGKTYSALRLATGMQRVTGGEIYLIDTESNRALHYAEHFSFRHVPFKPPFSPLDYIAAIEHCVNKGAKIIIVDSLSHEHEGAGGVLEWHGTEVQRMVNGPGKWTEQSANIPAWAKPKAARRKLINAIIQYEVNFVLCFRAKEKIKVGKKEVTQMGFMPIAGEEFVYELTAKSLLLPGAGGVPTLQSDQPGEQMMVKIPAQFREIFSGAADKPLDEGIGEAMAKWAAGNAAPNPAADLLVGYEECADQATFDQLESQRADAWPALPAADKKKLKEASDSAKERVAEAATSDTQEL